MKKLSVAFVAVSLFMLFPLAAMAQEKDAMMFWSTTTIKKSLGKEKRFSGCAPLSWTDDECFREEDDKCDR